MAEPENSLTGLGPCRIAVLRRRRRGRVRELKESVCIKIDHGLNDTTFGWGNSWLAYDIHVFF